MTQEEAIKFKEEIKAFQEGKTIQLFTELANKWIDTMDPMFNHENLYRIKPESTKRLPTIEEVEKWFMDGLVFRENFPNIELKRQTLVTIQSLVPRGSIKLLILGVWYTLEQFCNNFTHYDGSELYITE